jgi:proline iminopeptidase
MQRAVADLEAIRSSQGVDAWIVVGHSWGCDLAVRYAVEHPRSTARVVGIAGRGPQRDRTWSEAYEAGRHTETVDIEWNVDVHAALSESFTEWVRSPDLWRRLADCEVPMHFLAAEDDIRPDWPLRQLAALVPHGTFSTVPGVAHNFWDSHPRLWVEAVTAACTG